MLYHTPDRTETGAEPAVKRHLAWIETAAVKRTVAALFCAAWCILPFLLPPNPEVATGIDSSWRIGLTHAHFQGEVSGRDFYATYGWLYQLLGEAAREMHRTGSPFDSFFLLLLLENALALLLLGAALAAIDRIGWPTVAWALLMLFFLGFLQGAIHRPALALLAVVLLWRASRGATPGRRLVGAGASALLAFAAQLLSFEVGIFAVAAGTGSLLLLAALARWGRGLPPGLPAPRRALVQAAVFVGVFAAANLALAVYYGAAGPDGFGAYHRVMLGIIGGYGYALAFPWVLPAVQTTILFLLFAYAALFVVTRARLMAAEDLSLLLFLGAFGAVAFKAATVRADADHIWLGALPLLLVFLLLGRDFTGGRKLTRNPVWYVLLFLFLAVWTGIHLDRLKLPFEMARRGVSPLALLSEFQSYRGSRDIPLPPALAERRGRPEGLLVFPYQTHLAAVAIRPLVAPFIQAYQADTIELQRIFVEHLERRREPFEVLYALDGEGSEKLERVQNISRSPVIFHYLFENFAPLPGGTAGFLLLEKRPAPRPLAPRAVPGNATAGDGLYADFALVKEESCALVRLRLRLDYPALTFLGRASHVEARFLRGEEPVTRTALVALDGEHEFETWVSLLPEDRFAEIWNEPGPAGPAWDRIRFHAMDDTLLAFAPKTVAVSRVECVSF